MEYSLRAQFWQALQHKFSRVFSRGGWSFKWIKNQATAAKLSLGSNFFSGSALWVDSWMDRYTTCAAGI